MIVNLSGALTTHLLVVEKVAVESVVVVDGNTTYLHHEGCNNILN